MPPARPDDGSSLRMTWAYKSNPCQPSGTGGATELDDIDRLALFRNSSSNPIFLSLCMAIAPVALLCLINAFSSSTVALDRYSSGFSTKVTKG